MASSCPVKAAKGENWAALLDLAYGDTWTQDVAD